LKNEIQYLDNFISNYVVNLKKEYIKKYPATSIIREFIPVNLSDNIPISRKNLKKLNEFAKCNPIYFKSYTISLFNLACISYEGDINQYMLSGKKYDTNYQPFYPTWILSAYILALGAKILGFKEVVDIGCGDGRIAYCGELLNLKSIGIEIDSALGVLQDHIYNLTRVDYQKMNQDAISIDYSYLKLEKPMFFISGLPEMGEMLAIDTIKKIKEIKHISDIAGFNFMGSHLMKEYSRDKTKWGWGEIIKKFDLEILGCTTLPTHWTNDQLIDTPYVYTQCK
jgi:hypothetical protein